MLTNDDKKFILDTITFAITQNNKVLGKRFDETNKRISDLTIDVVDLFEATNSAILKTEERLSEKIDKLSEKVSDIDNSVDNHDRRIEKLEEKVFTISP